MMLELIEFGPSAYPPRQFRRVEYKGLRSNKFGKLCLCSKRPGFAGQTYRDVMHVKRIRAGGREWLAPSDTSDPQHRADEIQAFIETDTAVHTS